MFLACFQTWNYFEGIIKQILNSAFVGYEEFCRSRRVLSTSAFGIGEQHHNTLLNLQNSSYPTQPHSIIANYLPLLKLQISISGPGCTLEVIKCLNLNYWKQFFRILLLIMNRYSTLLINIYFFLTWSAHHSRILAVTTVTGYSPSSMTALF